MIALASTLVVLAFWAVAAWLLARVGRRIVRRYRPPVLSEHDAVLNLYGAPHDRIEYKAIAHSNHTGAEGFGGPNMTGCMTHPDSRPRSAGTGAY